MWLEKNLKWNKNWYKIIINLQIYSINSSGIASHDHISETQTIQYYSILFIIVIKLNIIITVWVSNIYHK